MFNFQPFQQQVPQTQPQQPPQQQQQQLKRRFDEFCANVRKRSHEIANASEDVVVAGEEGASVGRCPIRRKRFRRAKDIVKSAVADSVAGLSKEEAAFMETPEYFEMMRRIEEELVRELGGGQETEDDLLRAYEESQEFCVPTNVMCPVCYGARLSENPGAWIQCTACDLFLTISDPLLNAEYLQRMLVACYENHATVKRCPMQPVVKLSFDKKCLVFTCSTCNEYTVLI